MFILEEVLSFEPREGKVSTGQTISGFTVICSKKKKMIPY